MYFLTDVDNNQLQFGSWLFMYIPPYKLQTGNTILYDPNTDIIFESQPANATISVLSCSGKTNWASSFIRC